MKKLIAVFIICALFPGCAPSHNMQKSATLDEGRITIGMHDLDVVEILGKPDLVGNALQRFRGTKMGDRIKMTPYIVEWIYLGEPNSVVVYIHYENRLVEGIYEVPTSELKFYEGDNI